MLLLSLSNMERDSIKRDSEERDALSASVLTELPVPDTAGFSLNILADRSAADSFVRADINEDENAKAISRRVYSRDTHLEAETGATVSTAVTADFYTAANQDILSGNFMYNLYAADAAGSLSKLLASAALRDISGSVYINAAEKWYDRVVMNELSLYGHTFLISSSALDARMGATAVIYNRSILNSLESAQGTVQSLTAEGMEGSFTLETLLAASRSASQTFSLQAQNGAAQQTTDEDFYGLALGAKDVFPLYFGFGGSFVSASVEPLTIEPLEDLEATLASVGEIFADSSVTQNASAFSTGASLFAVCKLSEIAQLKTSVTDIGILPLPLLTTDAEYRTYINLDGTPLLAIPKGAADMDKVEYLVDRMAFLSHGYIEPLMRQNITLGNADDEQVLELIYDSAECDLSGLLGYGDMDGLLADAVLGHVDLRLSYYNRRTLYAKAIEIIEKRIAPEVVAAAAEQAAEETTEK